MIKLIIYLPILELLSLLDISSAKYENVWGFNNKVKKSLNLMES